MERSTGAAVCLFHGVFFTGFSLLKNLPRGVFVGPAQFAGSELFYFWWVWGFCCCEGEGEIVLMSCFFLQFRFCFGSRRRSL